MVSARLVLAAFAAVATTTLTGQEANALQLRGGEYLNALITHNTLQNAATAPPLGTCERFALHGNAGVTATGIITIEGDVGGEAALSGFGPAPLPHVEAGYEYYAAASSISTSCVADKQIAYDAAKAETCTSTVPTDLGSTTLTPGVYCSLSGTFSITAGTLTLDGGGDSDAVFIFQAASTVVTAASTHVVLTNSARAENVFWLAGSAITLGASSTFLGNLLAYSATTIGIDVALNGRVLTITESITMSGACQITLPAAATASPTTASPTMAPRTTTAPTTGPPTLVVSVESSAFNDPTVLTFNELQNGGPVTTRYEENNGVVFSAGLFGYDLRPGKFGNPKPQDYVAANWSRRNRGCTSVITVKFEKPVLRAGFSVGEISGEDWIATDIKIDAKGQNKLKEELESVGYETFRKVNEGYKFVGVQRENGFDAIEITLSGAKADQCIFINDFRFESMPLTLSLF